MAATATHNGVVTKRARVNMRVATCTAPVNIAVIKYWGKRHEEKILPINSSISGTLSQNELHAKTTVAASSTFQADRIWLNKKEEDIGNKRLQRCLSEIRALARKTNPEHPALGWKVHICSENNFPTAAGLASSAAGYAALVYTLAHVFDVQDQELTAIARMGSGSACRSLMGGFVRWSMGDRADGVDSVASQVVPETHWPDMEVLILVVNAGKKGTSSTLGMGTSVKTSALIEHRAKVVVPARMAEMETALQRKDFDTFAKVTMQDSNQFHAICLDTYPPITYMNDVSRTIIAVMTRFNQHAGEIKAAYTFDAGPNAVIYARKADVAAIVALVAKYFPPTETTSSSYFRGRTTAVPSEPVPADLSDAIGIEPTPGGVQYILHTGIGAGPQVLSEESSLLGSDGLPL